MQISCDNEQLGLFGCLENGSWGRGNHSLSLCSALHRLYLQSIMLDVRLFCNNEHIYAHKVVLAAGSPVLCDHIQNKENAVVGVMIDIEISGSSLGLSTVLPSDVKSLVDYLYSGDLIGAPHRMPNILALARALQIVGFFPTANTCEVPTSATNYVSTSFPSTSDPFIGLQQQHRESKTRVDSIMVMRSPQPINYATFDENAVSLSFGVPTEHQVLERFCDSTKVDSNVNAVNNISNLAFVELCLGTNNHIDTQLVIPSDYSSMLCNFNESDTSSIGIELTNILQEKKDNHVFDESHLGSFESLCDNRGRLKVKDSIGGVSLHDTNKFTSLKVKDSIGGVSLHDTSQRHLATGCSEEKEAASDTLVYLPPFCGPGKVMPSFSGLSYTHLLTAASPPHNTNAVVTAMEEICPSSLQLPLSSDCSTSYETGLSPVVNLAEDQSCHPPFSPSPLPDSYTEAPRLLFTEELPINCETIPIFCSSEIQTCESSCQSSASDTFTELTSAQICQEVTVEPTNFSECSKEDEFDLKCSYCSAKLESEDQLICHLWQWHQIGTNLKCDLCNFTSPSDSLLTRHTLECHTIKDPLRCITCQKVFKTKGHLKSHSQSHLRDADHMFKCPCCPSKYNQKSNLVRHLGSVHHLDAERNPLSEPFNCSQCNFTTMLEHKLKAHMIRSHPIEKPFKCMECHYSSVEKPALAKHMRTHTQEKPYSCPTCNFQCVTVSSLARHRRSHTGEKPYQCQHCGQQYADGKRLRDHLYKHDNVKPFMCHLCGYTCRRKDNLQLHVNIHKKRSNEIDTESTSNFLDS